MIGKLKGIIDSVSESHAILDVNGVGYVVFCSSSTLSEIENIRDEISLVIETHVREDHIHLYGFLSEAERDWFNLLTTVQGVGAKMALAIQNCFKSDELTNVIAAQDNASLTRANGVGKKLAERIITELKNKVASMPVAGGINDFAAKSGGNVKASFADSDIREQAVSALVNLGYNRIDAFSAVSRVLSDNDNAGLDDAIRMGLQELAS